MPLRSLAIALLPVTALISSHMPRPTPCEWWEQQTQVLIQVFPDAPGNDNENLNGEFVTITNMSGSTIDLSGWRICDVANHCYTFPSGASFSDGQQVKVYTGSGRQTGLSYYMNRSQAVWNNDRDTATLTNAAGQVVARHSYPVSSASPLNTTTDSRQPTQTSSRRPCCKICRTGKACGDGCIARNKTCRKPPGCACNGGHWEMSAQ
jgi:hypothetical protein